MTFHNKQNGYQIFWFSEVLSGTNFLLYIKENADIPSVWPLSVHRIYAL